MDADIDTELLISLVQDRPVLWDKSHEDYKSRASTAQGWREVCVRLIQDFGKWSETEKNKNVKLIIKKWKNVKDQYVKSLRKRKERSGSGAKTVRNYIYHDQLSFLKEVVDMKETGYTSEIDPDRSPDGQDEDKEDSDTQEKPCEVPKVTTFKPPLKRKKSDVEREILEQLSSKEDRHLSFFKGLLPSLTDFNDDETLQFQSGVISVIQNIKKARSFPCEVLATPQPTCICRPQLYQPSSTSQVQEIKEEMTMSHASQLHHAS